MTLSRQAAVAAIAVAVAGCLNLSQSSAVQPLAADYARGAHVELINLSREAVKTSLTPGFDAMFASRVKARLDRCAAGPRPLVLEARIDQLNKVDVLMTVLLAGQNRIIGHARLVDPASGQVVGDYRIGRTIIGRGMAILQMGEAEEQLSDAFGDEICKRAFPAPKPAATR